MKIQGKGIFFSFLLPFLLVASTYFSTKNDTPKSKQVSQIIETKTEKVEKEATTYYNVGNVPMNRKGRNVKRKPGVKIKYNGAHTGFLFDADDNNTQKWRPQGITGMGKKVNNKSILIVSWYGRPKGGLNKKNYKDRGGRISIVNVSDMSKIKYRHVLLVDKDLNTFPNCHVGGLAVIGDKLHVADSRGSKNNPLPDGSYDKILVFDLTKIEKLDTPVKKYSYVLRLESSYNVPVNPGYVSYNKNDDELMIGTFSCGKSGPCKKDFKVAPAKFVFGKPGSINRSSSFITLEDLEAKHNREFRKVQGMSTFTYKEKKYLIIADSYKLAGSHFNLFEEKNGKWEWVAERAAIPPGLEDVYVSSKNVWSLTEFSPAELGDRAVMAWRISKMVNIAKENQQIRESQD